MKGRGTQELGKLVEQLRKAVGYDTQEQFAHAAKMHPSIYNKLTRHDTQYLRGVRADEYLRGIIAALIIDANRRSGISMNEVDAIIQVWPRPLSPTETQW